MRPDQLGDFRVPSDVQLHPDGVQVAFVVTRLDLDGDRYERRLWLWDGARARRLTHGPADTRPRWSPGGEHLAFLRKGSSDDDRPQLAILPMSGGEAELVTSFELGVSEAEWSPDGTHLAVVASDWTEDWRDLEPDERARRPRRIDRLPYRGDNRGWTHDRRSHVYLVAADGSSTTCLTPGDFDESSVVWSPDGSTIAFLSARHPEREHDPATQLWLVPVKGGDAIAHTPVGIWGTPSFDRAGTLHVIGRPDRWALPDVMPLCRIERGAAVPITAELDRNLVTFSPPLAPAGPQWLDDGSALSTLEDAGRIRVIRLAANGTPSDVVGGDRVVTGVAPRLDGSAFAFTASAPTDPGEVWWWENGSERRLTHLNRDFTAGTDLVDPERFTYVDEDGAEIEGWVYLPGGGEQVPTLLNIHGGPATQYGYGFFDEFQVYVGAGYGVVAVNPRGSSGYGSRHVRAVVGRWHEELPPDLVDLRRAIPEALDRFSRLDGSRCGVMGGSYGGLATIRLLALDDRYRSAIAERGLYSWPSFAGTSDIGPWFEYTYLQARLPDGIDTMWQASPLAHASRVTAPTLIIHSESDFRTPMEQAEQLFVLLRRSGVETELVRFPAGEGHEMSRSGTPRHRRERFEIILEWHARHLA